MAVPTLYLYAAALVVIYLAAKIVNAGAIAKLTVINETKQLNKPLDAPRLKGLAVVVGGSVAGLANATVLACHYDEVLIIDEEPQQDVKTTNRPRVGQMRSNHVMTALGLVFWRKFCHNFDQRLKAAGIHVRPMIKTMYMFNGFVRVRDRPESAMAVCSRPAFESVVRSLVAESTRITTVSASVTELNLSASKPDYFESVKIRRPDGSTELIAAAIIIDCTGKSMTGAKWLAKAGYHAPEMQAYDAKVKYRTFWFTPSKEVVEAERLVLEKYPVVGFNVPTFNSSEMMGTFMFIEDERLQVGFMDVGGYSTVPDDKEGILEAIKTLPLHPECRSTLVKLLESCEVHDDVASFVPKGGFQILRYDKLSILPANLISCGDAVSSVNPIYGQGTGKAAMGATALDNILREIRSKGQIDIPKGFAKQYYAQAVPRDLDIMNANCLIDRAWETTEPYPGTKREYSGGEKVLIWYIEQIVKGTHVDPLIGETWYLANQKQRSPLVYFTPSFMFRLFYARAVGRPLFG